MTLRGRKASVKAQRSRKARVKAGETGRLGLEHEEER